MFEIEVISIVDRRAADEYENLSKVCGIFQTHLINFECGFYFILFVRYRRNTLTPEIKVSQTSGSGTFKAS